MVILLSKMRQKIVNLSEELKFDTGYYFAGMLHSDIL
jgi:hypothetical protein